MAENTIPRALREALARHFQNDKRTVSAFEQLFDTVESNGAQVASAAAATVELKDATVLVLSENAALTNERILRLDPGLTANDDGTFLTISLEDVARTEGFSVTLIPPGDAVVEVPVDGELLAKEHIGAQLYGNFVDDTAAAAGGVPVDGVYRNGSILMVRVV
jgi:hypothetical protein